MNPIIAIDRERGIVHVRPRTLVIYEGVGIAVNCALNEPEHGCQPYVTVNTEELPPPHTYDESDPSKPGGMPKIAVHLGDCTLYDDEGTGYKTDLRTGDSQVYVVRPDDPMSDLAAFIREEDAEEFAATFEGECGDVERVTICDQALAAKMIAERKQDEYEYRATFRAEAWVNDYATPVDPAGPTEWDCTAYVDEPTLAYLHRCADRSGGGRRLSEGVMDVDDVFKSDPAAPEWIREWRGPFTIRIYQEEPNDDET